MSDEEIKKIPKETYKKIVKNMVNRAAFKEYTEKKETHQKIQNLEYEQLELQPYLKSNEFSGQERKLLTLLRSRCHPARKNFKKMYQNQINCNLDAMKTRNTHSWDVSQSTNIARGTTDPGYRVYNLSYLSI